MSVTQQQVLDCLAKVRSPRGVALTEAQVTHEGHIYKGANHGFHNDTTPRYDEAAAKEAWQHTLDWFNKYLRASGSA